MTVDSLKESMSSKEFMGWVEYDKIEPIGPQRVDYLASMICSTMYCLWSRSKVSPAEIMPQWKPKKKKNRNEMLQTFRAFEALRQQK